MLRSIELRTQLVGDVDHVRWVLPLSDSEQHQFDPYDEVASLIRGVAHEINNPMSFIRAHAENIDLLLNELSDHLRELPEDLDRDRRRPGDRTPLTISSLSTRFRPR